MLVYFVKQKQLCGALLEMGQPHNSLPLFMEKSTEQAGFGVPSRKRNRGACAPQTQGPSAQHLADILNTNLAHQKEARPCSEEPV